MKNIFIDYHLKKYPKMTTQDLIKLVYQEVLGPTHIITSDNLVLIKNYILNELKETKNPNENLYEYLGNNYIRMNIHKYNDLGFNFDDFLNLFVNSNQKVSDLNCFKTTINNLLTKEDLKDYNYQPINHSSSFKEAYLPHYRIILSKYLTLEHKLSQIKNYLSSLPSKQIIALEGRCASGKTTISNYLKEDYTIIEVDDFFLPMNKKTNERLSEIGGNINYELIHETLKKLKEAIQNNEQTFTYLAFDCSCQAFYEKSVLLKDKIILEGVYSYHSYFQEYIDQLIYLHINKDEQLERINQRALKNRFINEWIPMEEKYYDSIKVESICNLII